MLGLAERRRPETTPIGDPGAGFAYSAYQSASTKMRLADLETLYDLRGVNGFRTYRRMVASDPKVYGLLQAVDLPLLRAEATIEPCEAGSPAAEKIAQFVRDALFDHFPWRGFLRNALTYKPYGFAAFEVVWRVDGSAVYVDRLSYRPCETLPIEGMVVENGRLSEVTQYTAAGSTVKIPGEKLLWLSHDKDGDNFAGRPLLRPCHKPWYAKEKAEVLLLIIFEKLGGIPVFREEGAALNKATRDSIDAAARAFRGNEQMFFRLPQGVAFELAASQVSLADGLEMLRYWDTQLTQVFQAQALDLGTTQAGNRALGQVFADMLYDSVQATGNYIEDVLNASGGLIEQLVAYNFPGSSEAVPKLRFGAVANDDLKATATALQQMAAAGLLTPTPEMEEFIRAKWNLPAADLEAIEAEKERAAKAKAAANPFVSAPPAPSAEPTVPPPASGAPSAQEDEGTQAAECGHDHSLRLAEALNREPRGVELYADLADMAGTFDEARTAIRDATAEVRANMVRELVTRAQTAVASGDPKRVAALAQQGAPMLDALAGAIKPVLLRFYEAGKRQVFDELQRQAKGEPVVDREMENREALGLADHEGPLPDPEFLRKYQVPDIDDAVLSYIDETARVQARTVGAAVTAETAHSALRALRTAMTDEAMAQLVQRASDASALRAGMTLTRLVDMGRADVAAANRERLRDATYSAILDKATCEFCEPRDGETTTDVEAAESWTPNPSCLGGDACRCVTFYSIKDGA